MLPINRVPYDQKPIKLFKHYSLNEYNIESIENSCLSLNNPSDFKDPFDCTYNQIKERQIKPIDGLPVPIQKNDRNKGVLCFSTFDNHPLMWHRYTGY